MWRDNRVVWRCDNMIRTREVALGQKAFPLLLGAADLGLCLHRSSSGLDLPMKAMAEGIQLPSARLLGIAPSSEAGGEATCPLIV